MRGLGNSSQKTTERFVIEIGHAACSSLQALEKNVIKIGLSCINPRAGFLEKNVIKIGLSCINPRAGFLEKSGIKIGLLGTNPRAGFLEENVIKFGLAWSSSLRALEFLVKENVGMVGVIMMTVYYANNISEVSEVIPRGGMEAVAEKEGGNKNPQMG